MNQKKVSSIRIFLGENTKHSREALRCAVDETRAKDPGALVSRFDDISFDSVLLREALMNQSIFGVGNIVVIDGILDNENGEEFYRTLESFKNTANTVLIRETSPGKDVRALLKEIGDIKEFPLKKTETKKNSFAIADAVAMRNKRSAWVEFIRLKRSGAVMEEVHGMIFWAVKMLYVCATGTREEAAMAGVKDYTYHIYLERAKNFPIALLEKKLGELKDMYHRAHQGDRDLGIFLEQFLLKL
ncbi:MAG: hypothetical protein AAB869_03495 [Patescibacteria group bacterium]